MKVDFKRFDLRKYLNSSSEAKNIYVEPETCEEFSAGDAVKLYSKDNFYISNIFTTKINQTTIVVPKEIDQSEVPVAYEEDIIEDLALDNDKEYIIKVEKSDVDMGSMSDEYNVYVVQRECVEKLFGDCSDVKHIDLILPTPLLFKPLIDLGFIEQSGVKLFFWYDENECFASAYSDNKFLGFRLLKHSLADLTTMFNESSPSLVSKDELLEIISSEEIKPEFENPIKRVYSTIAEDIDDTMIFFKRIYSYDDYKVAYIDSPFGLGKLLYEYLEANYGRVSESFGFLESIGSHKKSETLKDIALFYAQSGLIDKTYNFTIYPKPKPILQRDSGRLAASISVGALIAFSIPAYYLASSYIVTQENKELTIKESSLKKEATSLESDLNELQAALKTKQEAISKVQNSRDSLLSVLSSYTMFEKNYVKKSEVILQILSLLQKDSLYLKELSFYKNNNDDVFELDIVANSDDDISSFVDRSIKEGGFDIKIEKISQIDDKLYESRLKVVLR